MSRLPNILILRCLPVLLFFMYACEGNTLIGEQPLLVKETERQIDTLFAEWDQSGHPGGSVGIMMDGKVIYAKGFGLASLEFGIPNTDTTLYNIASVSKQFTAYAMLLLQQRGEISLEDEIHTYFPRFKDFGYPLTIRHMIHHTSGLRSLHALMHMAGWRDEDKRTNEDLMRLMLKQEELNFRPGDEYLYCNTGYMLMAEIVEQVSGQDFVVWMDENVFAPLGMENAYVEREYDRVVPGNAVSYDWYEDEQGFRYAVPYWGYVGSGNIHTNIYDLLKWQQYLNNPPADQQEMVEAMFERGILNSGDTLNYAAGLSTFQDYKGEQGFGHGGSIGGYRASIQSVPEHQLNVVVLTNFSNSRPSGKAFRIIDIMLGKEVTAEEDDDEEEEVAEALNISPELAGNYYSPELQVTYQLRPADEYTALLEHPRHGAFEMQMFAKDTLEGDYYAIRRIVLERDAGGRIGGFRATNGRVRNMRFVKVE